MKKLTIFASLLLSFNALAGTILDCQNTTSSATYLIRLTDGNQKLQLSPLLKDASALSTSNADLEYYEGESSPDNSQYGGTNANGNSVALELNTGTSTIISKTKMIEAIVYFTEANPNKMTGKAFLNCSLR